MDIIGLAGGAVMAATSPAASSAPPAPPILAVSQQVAPAQNDDIVTMRHQIADERAQLEQQQKEIEQQRRRLETLEAKLAERLGESPQPVATASQPGEVPLPPSPPPTQTTQGGAPGVATVGQAPTEQRQVQVAILAEQGGIITRRGRLTLEGDVEYTRADNNTVIFRGVEIPTSVLIGVFDINQSRQDLITAAGVVRLGVTNRLELNARIPFVYQSSKTVLAPVADPNNPNAGQLDRAVTNANLGDVEFGFRYQFTNGHNGSPYLIAGVQAVVPSGIGPFSVPYDSLGNALKATTGAGFWGITPNLTAILPTDPAVLFATLGYTINIGRNVDKMIGPAFIEHVSPGGEPNASVGIAISLNPRTSISFGYAHTWVLGTRTRFETTNTQTGELGDETTIKTRDLQLGRLLFGISYRVNPKTTINWTVEGGLTADAPEVRTAIRIPFTFDAF